MSTAGKVLSVLTILLALVWVMLSSALTEFNKAGAKAVEKAKADLVSASETYQKLVVDLQATKDETDKQQVKTLAEVTELRERQADKEKERSQALQLASRIKLQVEGADASLKAAEILDKERLEEKEAETKALEETKTLVAKLMGENNDFLAKLSELRDQFAKTLQANKAMTDRLNKAGNPPKVPTTSRPATPGARVPVSASR